MSKAYHSAKLIRVNFTISSKSKVFESYKIIIALYNINQHEK